MLGCRVASMSGGVSADNRIEGLTASYGPTRAVRSPKSELFRTPSAAFRRGNLHILDKFELGVVYLTSGAVPLNLPASNPPGCPGFYMRSDHSSQLTSGSPSSAEHVSPVTAGHRQIGKTIAAKVGEEEVVQGQ